MAANTNINNYKQTVMGVTSDLNVLRDCCAQLGLDPSVSGIDEVLRRLAEDTFNVAIVGEFKRGKSTLINALLEQPILPADVLPCSATLNRVAYGIEPHAVIEYRDGHTEDVPVDALENYVTKLTPESERRAANVSSATVYYPISFCKNGVTIIDTPGLNDDAAMTEVTLSVLPEADAAIMVMMCGSPFSESEREFLESKIMASDLGRVLFVVTGIDRYDEEEQAKLLELFRNRITESVLNKARDVYGEGSPEYATYQRKLGNVKIFPVSARDALRAKMNNDDAKLRESRFPEFEDGLIDFLVRDRGALQLSAPVSRAKNSAAEVLKAIELRTASLSMSEEEFAAKYEEAMAQIAEIREARAAELQKVGAAADEAYRELGPQIDSFWENLEAQACAVVDGYPITSLKELRSSDTTEAINNAVANAMQNESQLLAERIQHTIEGAVADEAERLGGFEEYFFDATSAIQGAFTDVKAQDSSVGAMVGAVAANYFTGGLGNAYLGYKQGGWKGALLGTGVAAAGTFGTGFGIGLIAVAAGVTALGPAAILAMGLASAAAGTALGNKVVDMAFKSNKIEKFREDYKAALHDRIIYMKAENNYAAKVREQVDNTFDALKQRVTTETETVLENTQSQLSDLKAEIASGKMSREQEAERLTGLAERASAVLERMTAIEDALTRILAQQA